MSISIRNDFGLNALKPSDKVRNVMYVTFLTISYVQLINNMILYELNNN